MILFIHGFASCGLGNKSTALIEYFGKDQILAPDLSHEPETAMIQLETLLQQHSIDLLIGSSLGGYYVTWLKRQYAIPAVLVNPAVVPFALLDDYIGRHKGCGENEFELTQIHLDTLRNWHRSDLGAKEKYLVLLQSDDEVLDYQQAAAYYANKEIIVEEGGSHRFDHFEKYLPKIKQWRENNA